mgnify:CR=1 FL=1
MNELFAKLPYIGDLYYHNEYLFYDEPQIFSCISRAFQLYFATLIESDSKIKKWLLVPISIGKLNMLENNSITIREIFTKPENEIIWGVISIDNTFSIEEMKPEDLTDSMLPLPGECLDLDNGDILADHSALTTARDEMRDIIDISFERENEHIREIPCITLSEELENTQQLFYALAYKEGGLYGPVPKQIKRNCCLCVSDTFAASFGVRFKSNELCDIYFETPLTNTLREFNTLLALSNNKDQMKDFLSTQSPRVAIRYRRFIKSLLTHKTALKIKNASPNNASFEKHLSTDELLKSLDLIDSELNELVKEERLYGKLIGINVDKQTFDFISTDDEKIHGYIAPELGGNVYSVPQVVEITLEEKIDVDSVTHEEKIINKLISIKPIVKENGNGDQ